MKVISFKKKFNKINEFWVPKLVGELNGQYIKLAKFKGEFVWHSHDHEDEYFQIVKGSIKMHLRDRSIEINEGESIIIPKGVEHRPEARNEAHVMMFEPKSTIQTGKV